MARPDPVPLVLKLEDQGLGADQIVSALTGMGFTKSEARAAISAAGISSTPQASPKSSAGGTAPTPLPVPPADTAIDEQGASPASSPAGGGRRLPKFDLPDAVASPTLKMPTSMPSSADIASLLTGLLLYTVFLNYMRYGPAGVKGWFRAKFMNDPLDTVTARLEAEGSKLQAPQVGGSAALSELLGEPLEDQGGFSTSSNGGIDPGPIAPSGTNVLNA